MRTKNPKTTNTYVIVGGELSHWLFSSYLYLNKTALLKDLKRLQSKGLSVVGIPLEKHINDVYTKGYVNGHNDAKTPLEFFIRKLKH